jgi:hypothetical protein
VVPNILASQHSHLLWSMMVQLCMNPLKECVMIQYLSQYRTYPTSYISYLDTASVNFFVSKTTSDDFISQGVTCNDDQTRRIDFSLSGIPPGDRIFPSPTTPTSKDNGAYYYPLPSALFDSISRLDVISRSMTDTNIDQCIGLGIGGGTGPVPVVHTTVAALTTFHSQVVITMSPDAECKFCTATLR